MAGELDARWSMVAVGYVRLGRTGKSDGSIEMSVRTEDGEDR